MTNYEKHKDEIIKHGFIHNGCSLKKKLIDIDCGKARCDDCEKIAREWLEAEYVEPKVDWNKVPMGTPVRVWDRDEGFKQRGRYVVFRDDMHNLRHEVLVDGDNTSRPFKCAELIEVDNESNTND